LDHLVCMFVIYWICLFRSCTCHQLEFYFYGECTKSSGYPSKSLQSTFLLYNGILYFKYLYDICWVSLSCYSYCRDALFHLSHNLQVTTEFGYLLSFTCGAHLATFLAHDSSRPSTAHDWSWKRCWALWEVGTILAKFVSEKHVDPKVYTHV
jgi:hypothetical protein